MKHSIILLVLFASIKLNAQTNEFLLKFKPIVKQQELKLNERFNLSYISKDSTQITKLKFYISAIELYNDKELVYTEKNSFHLIDASDTNSYSINLKDLTALKVENGLTVIKLSGWKKVGGSGKTFLSLAVNRYVPEQGAVRQENQAQSFPAEDSDIPF